MIKTGTGWTEHEAHIKELMYTQFYSENLGKSTWEIWP